MSKKESFMKKEPQNETTNVTTAAADLSEKELRQHLAKLRKGLESSALSSDDLKAWTSPLTAISMMELHFATMNLVEKLASDFIDLQQQHQELLQVLANYGVVPVR